MWYGYGHGGSSIFFVLLVIGIFALRMYAGRRRTHGGPAPRPPRSAAFHGGRPPAGSPPAGPSSSAQGRQATERDGPSGWGVSHTGIPAGWMIDPSGLHEQRYWSGADWTDHVTDRGVPSTDPLPVREPPAAPTGDGDAAPEPPSS